MTGEVCVQFVDQGYSEAVRDLASAIEAKGSVPVELLERLRNLVERVVRPVSTVVRDASAGGALDRRMLLKPSDALLDLVIAVRAWDGKDDSIFDAHASEATGRKEGGERGSI